jgi:hypothetical protein
MQAGRRTRGAANVELSRDELEILNNALNEVCHGLDIEEFSIRMGAEKPEVLRLLHRISEIMQQLD